MRLLYFKSECEIGLNEAKVALTKDEIALTEDLIEDIPPYAILCHTWGAESDEVTFIDISNGVGRDKAGYNKIKFCGQQARKDGLQYFWVDTCCIDESNHLELSKAVNSMFSWYSNAVKCYVYLSDVSTNTQVHDISTPSDPNTMFRTSKWFARCWTLQELLAPKRVEFFSREMVFLGDKAKLIQQISDITEERMQWVSRRQTACVEDAAYSLLGIFGITMPLIYGEGENALVRLQREIEKCSDQSSDTSSDVSQAFSVESTPSLISASSSASIMEEAGSKAAEHMASLLSEDPGLAHLYRTAVATFGSERFQNNHDKLLKEFFKDLRDEAQTATQLETIRILRRESRRHEITCHIQLIFYSTENRPSPANLAKRSEDSKQLLEYFLRRRFLERKQNRNSSLEQGDEFERDKASSGSSDEDDDSDQLARKYTYVEPLERFITTGSAFHRFKSSFSYLLQPPYDLSQALKSGNSRVLHRFLARNFEIAATGAFSWLQELVEIGYSYREMASLLLEAAIDSPWIYFDAQTYPKGIIDAEHHLGNCIHSFNLKFGSRQTELYKRANLHLFFPHGDIRRQVEELCGLGGVAPSSRDTGTWLGSVTFDTYTPCSSITLCPSSFLSRQYLLSKLVSILQNFCTAAAALQNAGLCCDSFTAFWYTENSLVLQRIELRHAKGLKTCLDLTTQSDSDIKAGLARGLQYSCQILRCAKPPDSDNSEERDLHYCALAAQFLCVAFLSYIQAHIGPIEPFFLEVPQRKILLCGSRSDLEASTIVAELFRLTCLDEMAQQPVLAFRMSTMQNPSLHVSDTRFDVETDIAECLDTWGPGYCIYNKSDPTMIDALAVGGGFISMIDSETNRFHWTSHFDIDDASHFPFDVHTKMRIGAIVSVSEQCRVDETAYRRLVYSALQPLDTRPSTWEVGERQAGLQAGQYVNGSYMQTWKKIRGITLKQDLLKSDDCHLIYFLEQTWGLQVSLCTRIAHRVRLRELVADLLPAFFNPPKQLEWRELLDNHSMISTFLHGDLFEWLRGLRNELQKYVLFLVREILTQLRCTGLDDQKTCLALAWPQVGDTRRCLRLPCEGQTRWAQILADAEDCATFAYVTTKCLETQFWKCPGDRRAWQNISKMLVTEISPSYPGGLPTSGGANISTMNVVSFTPAQSTSNTVWKLEDRKVYYVKKMDALLQVRVERSSTPGDDVAHLVVSKSRAPQGMWKRLLINEEKRENYRIREKQVAGDHAESVVIRAELM